MVKELHEIGLQEWADIQEEMKVISSKLGHGCSIPHWRDTIAANDENTLS